MRLYEKIPLPMIMLRGWFNDQCKCFELLYQLLTDDEQTYLFTSRTHFEAMKRKYRQLYFNNGYDAVAKRNIGEHKRPEMLNYKAFERWADCVFRAVGEAGTLETLLETIGSVEAAHDTFKHWFYPNANKIRYLNVADAARILAACGYLEPEKRPLLARGALRGAAIYLNGEPSWKRINRLEREYADKSTRIALEEKAAAFINDCIDFEEFGKLKMEAGENWFCEEIHKRT